MARACAILVRTVITSLVAISVIAVMVSGETEESASTISTSHQNKTLNSLTLYIYMVWLYIFSSCRSLHNISL